MSKLPSLHRISCCIAVFVVVATPACTTRNAYRPVRGEIERGDSVPVNSGRRNIVRDHLEDVQEIGEYKHNERVPGRESECLEKYSASNFWLGHVEMTDYGTYQSRHQMGVIERAVEQDLGVSGSLFKRGITVVVFVHGWSNNATETNGNLQSFRELLSDVGAEQKRRGRGVLGVYLSWRGASLKMPLKPLTYWARARAADAIGSGVMVEALARIKNIHWLVAQGAGRARPSLQIYQNSRMVMIGHSFGGRALYAAAGTGLEAAFMQPYWAARSFPAAMGKVSGLAEATMQRVTGFGDLVLLINPALPALPYRKIHHSMHRNINVNFDRRQPVLMMVLTSQNDTPNKMLLPLGETIGNRGVDLFARQQDRTAARQSTTALGHFTPFHSHQLTLRNGALHLAKTPGYFAPVRYTEDGEELKPPQPVKTLRRNVMSFRGAIKTDEDPGFLPFMVVSTTRGIINGHSGFWPTPKNRIAYEFVTAFIRAQNEAVGEARQVQAAEAAERVVPQSY